MNAGAYREKIEVQKIIGYQGDSLGNQKAEWQTFYKGFAYVNNLSGSEYWEAAQIQAENTVMFFLRYHKRLREVTALGHRILWKGEEYDIKFVDDIQNKHETIKIRAVKKEKT